MNFAASVVLFIISRDAATFTVFVVVYLTAVAGPVVGAIAI